MAQNLIQEGERLDYVVPAATTITSGQGVVVGSFVGVALQTGTTGKTIVVALEGVFQMPKVTGAVTLGAALYFDNTEKKVTTTVGSNKFIGFAWTAAASGDATVEVRLANAGAVTQAQAGNVAALGTTTALTAIAASYADLAAARTSVNTLRTDAEARLDAIEAKIDAVIASLVAAGIMAAS
jgi:predicted RecA/RadA family phage recombinase